MCIEWFEIWLKLGIFYIRFEPSSCSYCDIILYSMPDTFLEDYSIISVNSIDSANDSYPILSRTVRYNKHPAALKLFLETTVPRRSIAMKIEAVELPRYSFAGHFATYNDETSPLFTVQYKQTNNNGR